jgi:hypothetical protein
LAFAKKHHLPIIADEVYCNMAFTVIATKEICFVKILFIIHTDIGTYVLSISFIISRCIMTVFVFLFIVITEEKKTPKFVALYCLGADHHMWRFGKAIFDAWLSCWLDW